MRYTVLKRVLAAALSVVVLCAVLAVGAFAVEETAAEALTAGGLALPAAAEAPSLEEPEEEPAEEPAEAPVEAPAGEADAPAAEDGPALDGEGGVTLDSINFPDANFLSFVTRYDKDGDGALSETEIAAVTLMNCNKKSIVSLTGIGNFTSLKTLYCIGNSIEVLDLDGCVSLETLWCHDNVVMELLDVTGCPALKELSCYNNALTALNVTQNPLLEHINCANNKIASLNLHHSPLLVELYCEKNSLVSLDLTDNPLVENLTCSANKLLSTLEISACTNLKDLRCAQCSLYELNVKHLSELTRLWCFKNNLTALDVTHNGKLTDLSCYGNALGALDVSHNPLLTDLSCYNNRLEELDVSANPLLEELTCYGNELTSLRVTANPMLVWLTCYDNAITRLDISACPYLCEAYLNPTSSSTGTSNWYYGSVDGVGSTTLGVSPETEILAARPDLTGDGVMDGEDAALILRYVVFGAGISGEKLETADANGDGAVDARDATQILRYAGGLPSVLD